MVAAMVTRMRLTSMAMAMMIGVVRHGRCGDEIYTVTDANDGDTSSEGNTNSKVGTNNDGDTGNDVSTGNDGDISNDGGKYDSNENMVNIIEIVLSCEYRQEEEDRQDVMTGYAILMRESWETLFSQLDGWGKHVSRLREDDLVLAGTHFARFPTAAQREGIVATFGERLRLVPRACVMQVVHRYSHVPGATFLDTVYCFLVEQGHDLPEILRFQHELQLFPVLRRRTLPWKCSLTTPDTTELTEDPPYQTQGCQCRPAVDEERLGGNHGCSPDCGDLSRVVGERVVGGGDSSE